MANVQPPKKKLQILFHAIDGTGHLNACVGMAEALIKRGHTVLFLVNAAFKGNCLITKLNIISIFYILQVNFLSMVLKS